MTTVILAVDPGVHRLGLAICDLVTGSPLWCGSHPITEKHRGRTHTQIGAALTFAADGNEPAIVAVEDPTHASRGKKQAAQWGGVIALVEAMAAGRWPHIEFWRISPPGWKKAVGLAGNCPRDEYVLWAGRNGWECGRFADGSVDHDAAAAAGVARWAFLTNQRGQVAA